MVKVVSWNIGKREKPWRELAQMASEGDADLVPWCTTPLRAESLP